MKRHYRKKTCDDGKVMTVRKSQVCELVKRGPRTNTTTTAVAKNNKRLRDETYAHKLNFNFNDRDYFVVLSFNDDNIALAEHDVWRMVDNYCNRLSSLAERNGRRLTATLVPGIGDDGRIHIHMLVSRNSVEASWIGAAWGYGHVFIKEVHTKNGSFAAIATYYLRNADNCNNLGRTKPHKDIGMRSAPITCEDISEEEMFCVDDVEGYIFDYSNSYMGTDDYGHPYATLNYIKDDKYTAAKARIAGKVAGINDGYVDGYTSYTIGRMVNNAAAICKTRCTLGCNINGTSVIAIKAYSAGYISAYQTGFDKGQREAFRDIVRQSPVIGYNQLYFHGTNSFYLSEQCRYRYDNNMLYVSTAFGWYCLGAGVLYAVRNGCLTYVLPCGEYYTIDGINYLCSG